MQVWPNEISQATKLTLTIEKIFRKTFSNYEDYFDQLKSASSPVPLIFLFHDDLSLYRPLLRFLNLFYFRGQSRSRWNVTTGSFRRRNSLSFYEPEEEREVRLTLNVRLVLVIDETKKWSKEELEKRMHRIINNFHLGETTLFVDKTIISYN